MVKIKIDMKGLKAALDRAPSVVKEKVDKALAKNADEVAGGARALAEGHRLTGALIASIGTEKIADGYQIEASDDAAAANEWGTRKMEAQPFLFPAYRLNKKRGRRRVMRALKQGVKDAGVGE